MGKIFINYKLFLIVPVLIILISVGYLVLIIFRQGNGLKNLLNLPGGHS